MAGKRIVFTTATPNDQGGVIPNNTLDFSRFNRNPVMLCQHVWGDPPIGLMTDLQYDAAADEWSALPMFHKLSPESKLYSDLYEGGWIKACSIGGEAEWKTNNAGQLELDANGNRICEKFTLYEISIVTLPSNPDAVTKESLGAKLYSKEEAEQLQTKLVTLSSKYKTFMEPKDNKKTPEQIRLEAAQKELAEAQAAAEAVQLGANGGSGAGSNDPSIGQLPDVGRQIVTHSENMMDKFLAHFGVKPTSTVKNEAPPAQTGQPESKLTDMTVPQPGPTGLTAKQEAAKKKAEECRQAAEKACQAAEAAKASAEKEGASQSDKDDYAAKFAAAEACVNAALEAEDEYKSCMTEQASTNAAGAKPATTTTTNAAGAAGQAAPVKPKLKTVEELQAEAVKLAPKIENRTQVVKFRGVTFTELSSAKNEEGQRILGRVMTNSEEKQISDYQILLESLLIDDKYKAIVDKTRVITTTSGGYNDFRKYDSDLRRVKERPGVDLRHLAAKFGRGVVDVMDGSGVLREVMSLGAKTREQLGVKTTLGSTANLLAAPDLFTVEWLTLAIMTLYPSTDWKADIGMFGAEMTSKNTGIVWANIAADPAIYFGNKPVGPADYQTDDTPVSMSLISSYLQPMVWNPLTLHQLRYDKMAAQWAQAFAKWGSLMDDKLIYTLLSLIPVATSLVNTGGQPAVPQFTLTGANDPNSFFVNPTLVGSYATPAWADIIRLEQVYAKQNYNLETSKIILVTDPTADRYIATDNDTKSLLTRFTQSNPEDVLKIKHTKLISRSYVGAYDPASGQVKDPSGALPATTVSAMLSFIADQVALGLGLLDVFMVQDPSAYGYRMSADMREGAALIRQNGNGAAVYTYGVPNNP